uniref:SFRICE_019990 n=1 Tax=Spodoptera frugiperda TaxID=7108 RepID=A0A2H1V9T3_SPOFR
MEELVLKAPRSDEAIFGVTKKGNPVLIFNGYRYNKDSRSTGPKKRWYCTKSGCRANVHTIFESIVDNVHTFFFGGRCETVKTRFYLAPRI